MEGEAVRRADAVSVLLSMVTESIVAGPLRRSTTDTAEQTLDYIQRFDYHTRFYDVFMAADGRRIIAIGPPFTDEVRFSTWPEREPCHVEFRRPSLEVWGFFAQAIVTPPQPGACAALVMEARGRETVIPVQPNLGPFFAGCRVLIAKNRNMELLWMRDWAEFHAREHGFDAVVLYDNGSDRYTPGEIEQVLCGVPGVRRVAVVDMPASFGPVSSRTSRFANSGNFLQYAIPAHAVWRMAPQAELVMHLDIDELLVANDRDVFGHLLAEQVAPVLHIDGVNVLSAAPATDGIPRHRDGALISAAAGTRAGKWIAWPGALPDVAAPGLHGVDRSPVVSCPLDVATMYNVLAVSTGWHDAIRRWQIVAGDAMENPVLRATLDRQPWVDPDALGAWDPLSIDDPQALIRWGSDRLRDGDAIEALRAARAARERNPSALAAQELLAIASRAATIADLPLIARLTAEETVLLDAAARSAGTVIAYGVGEGTRRLAALGIEHVVIVENSPQWANTVQRDPLVAVASGDGRMRMQVVAMGPVTGYGFPASDVLQETWPKYWQAPWNVVEPAHVDLAIVDGRFRVACALTALLAGPDGLVVLIHDFWSSPWYHAVLAHAVEIGSAGRSVLLVRSRAFDAAAAEADLQAYAYDPR
jgi:hypothetical protein